MSASNLVSKLTVVRMYIGCGEASTTINLRSMFVYRRFILATLLTLPLRTPLLSAQNSPGDLLLLHGRVLTVDGHDSVAQAIAIRHGIIVKLVATPKSWNLPAMFPAPASSISMGTLPPPASSIPMRTSRMVASKNFMASDSQMPRPWLTSSHA